MRRASCSLRYLGCFVFALVLVAAPGPVHAQKRVVVGPALYRADAAPATAEPVIFRHYHRYYGYYLPRAYALAPYGYYGGSGPIFYPQARFGSWGYYPYAFPYSFGASYGYAPYTIGYGVVAPGYRWGYRAPYSYGGYGAYGAFYGPGFGGWYGTSALGWSGYAYGCW